MTGPELFRANYRGRPTTIGEATEQDLAVLAQPVATAACRDLLESWTLVAIRDPGRPGVEIHALGWRSKLRNTWMTSRLIGVDTAGPAVATWSGHVYLLGQPASPDLEPELRGHLGYALQTWGFDDVQS